MTKGKKWTLRLLGVAVLALLICLCLMGSTMARYTSQGDGSGSLTVALWDLETVKVDLPENESISPSADAYNAEATSARSNTSNWMIAFALENNSKVDAKVKVTEDGEGVSMTWPDTLAEGETEYTGSWSWGIGWNDTDGHSQTDPYGGPLMANFTDEATFTALVNSEGIFSIELGYSDKAANDVTDEDITPLSDISWDDESKWIPVAQEGTVYFYAEVVWTSADLSTTYSNSDAYKAAFADVGEYADAIDSILGMYVTTLSFGVTWTAIQASVQPEPDTQAP